MICFFFIYMNASKLEKVMVPEHTLDVFPVFCFGEVAMKRFKHIFKISYTCSFINF